MDCFSFLNINRSIKSNLRIKGSFIYKIKPQQKENIFTSSAIWFFFFLVTFFSLYHHKEKKVTEGKLF